MKHERIPLIKALESLMVGVSRTQVVEQSDHLAFLDGYVYSFNDAIAVSRPLDIGIRGAIEAEPFIQMLKKIKTDTVDLTTNDDDSGSVLILSSGRTNVGLPISRTISLPIEEIDHPEEWYPVPSGFNGAIGMVLVTCAKKSPRPIFTSVHLTSERMESADNISVTRVDMKFPEKLDLCVPGSSLDAVKGVPAVSMSFSDRWMFLQDEEGNEYSLRAFPSEFPSTDKVFRDGGDEIPVPDELFDAVDRVNILSRGNTDLGALVNIQYRKRFISVSAKTERGWVRDKIRNEGYDGEEISFKILPAMLLQFRGQFDRAIWTSPILQFHSENVHRVTMAVSEKEKSNE